jgi:hypothetical protein
MDHRLQSILQWNCRSIRNKKSDFTFLLNKYKPSIIVLNETWLKPGSTFKVSGYSCLRCDRSDGRSGTALLVNSSISFKLYTVPTPVNNFSIIAAIVNNICVVSIYIPHPSIPILEEVNSIINILPKPLLLIGDLNAHHTMWGCSKIDTCGNFIVDILDNHDLCVLNTGAPTLRTKPNEAISAIDICLASAQFAGLLTWVTLDSTYGLISFPNNKSQPNISYNPPKRYKITNNNQWSTFRNHVEQNIHSLPRDLNR